MDDYCLPPTCKSLPFKMATVLRSLYFWLAMSHETGRLVTLLRRMIDDFEHLAEYTSIGDQTALGRWLLDLKKNKTPYLKENLWIYVFSEYEFIMKFGEYLSNAPAEERNIVTAVRRELGFAGVEIFPFKKGELISGDHPLYEKIRDIPHFCVIEWFEWRKKAPLMGKVIEVKGYPVVYQGKKILSAGDLVLMEVKPLKIKKEK